MNRHGLVFHHLGLATKSPETARALLTGLGYRIGETVLDPRQQVNLALCTANGMPAVEIVSPTTKSGPVDGLLAKHTAGLVYHLCFKTADLPGSLQAMEAAGIHPHCVVQPTPAVLFPGTLLSFYLVNGFGLVEILEEVA